MKNQFVQHLNQRLTEIQKIMSDQNLDFVFIESGFPDFYFLDDQATFFKSNPYFLFLCPDPGQGHLLKISRNGGEKPKLYYHIPDDFWHEVSSLSNAFWESSFEIVISNDFKKSWEMACELNKKSIVISPHSAVAEKYGCSPIDDTTLNRFNWLRTRKTEYEVSCIRGASKSAAKGHRRAFELFQQGATEWDIYMEYLLASGQRESELPYNSIVALDQNSATLHYQFPKKKGQGKTFLIDAGARFNGYCSDITRTYVQNSVDDVYKQILSRIEYNQQLLCNMVHPGVEYIEIHKKSYDMVADILVEFGLFKGSSQEALDLKLPFHFYPHGVGHPLGLQVHDVAGKQAQESESSVNQPEDFPYLRTLRQIQEGDVLTIEPGFYLIPLLLEPLKLDSKLKGRLDWELIDRLTPYGGIRIEDNVFAGKLGAENLTRAFLN